MDLGVIFNVIFGNLVDSPLFNCVFFTCSQVDSTDTGYSWSMYRSRESVPEADAGMQAVDNNLL